MKTLLQQEILRCRNVLQTQLNAGNKVTEVNTYVSFIHYCATLSGHGQKLLKFRKVQEDFNHGWNSPPQGQCDQLYLPRQLGGRSLYQLLMLLNGRKALMEHWRLYFVVHQRCITDSACGHQGLFCLSGLSILQWRGKSLTMHV